jgi:hypothetical protein
MMSKNIARAVLIAMVFAFTKTASAEVTFEWVTIGNAGNAADPVSEGDFPGIGSVSYEYRIARYEVTNDQYAEFLNAVAATDTNAIYNTGLGSVPRGGIARSGTSGSYTYSIRTDMANKPVVYMSFFDSMRFVNWLHNGQPTGIQDASTTEDGVYAISDGISETRAANAKFFIPTQSEWYKAAYYDPRSQAEGGPPGDDNYWLYPTASDSDPTLATANATGDISNPGENVANYAHGADWNGQDGNVTTVGSAGQLSENYYGTDDQAGNVWEWNEALVFGDLRGQRGGNTLIDVAGLKAIFWTGDTSSAEFDITGFRIASPIPEAPVPAVSEWGLVAMLLLVLAAGTIVLQNRRTMLT